MRAFVGYGGPATKTIAKELYGFLKDNKIEVYMAPKDNPPGEWDPHVQGALKKADVFVPVYNPQSFRSKELYKEITLATEWGIVFESFLDSRVNRNALHFPRIIRDSDFVEFKRKDPAGSFDQVLLKLGLTAVRIPYRLTEPVEARPIS